MTGGFEQLPEDRQADLVGAYARFMACPVEAERARLYRQLNEMLDKAMVAFPSFDARDTGFWDHFRRCAMETVLPVPSGTTACRVQCASSATAERVVDAIVCDLARRGVSVDDVVRHEWVGIVRRGGA